jgi:hypothetical protein
MIKCRAIVLILIVLTFCKSYGQTNKFESGIEGSPSLIMLKGNDYFYYRNNPTIGYSARLFFQYNFKKIISLRTNLAFERKGSIVNSQSFDEYGNSFGSLQTKSKFDYLTIPLLVRATFGKRVLFFANAGPYLGYLLNQTDISKGENVPKTKTDNTSSFKRFDFGVSAGFGLLVPIEQNFALSFEARDNVGYYNISKVPVNRGSIETVATNFLFSFVYKFGFHSTGKSQL